MGYKEVIARIEGVGAYSRLKFESGTHRVQRVPETESQGRIHTSAATVAIATGIRDNRAGALTRGTGLLNREEPLLHAYLACAPACRTRDRLATFLRSTAAAGIARHLRGNLDRHRVTDDRLFQVQA